MKKILTVLAIMMLVVGTQLSMVTQAQAQPKYASSLNGWNTDYQLTGNAAEDLLSVAKAQVGKKGSELGYSIDWCACFVTDCARIAGIPTSTIGNYSYAAPGGFGLKEIDKTNYTPKAGDLVFFCWAGDNSIWNHVGIVKQVKNGVLYTIEGNTGSGGTASERVVKQDVYMLNSKYIRAYASLTGQTTTIQNDGLSAKQIAVRDYALGKVGTSFPNGYCQAFVSTVYKSNNCGENYYCCASKAWQECGVSTDRNNIPIGAVVYFSGSNVYDNLCGQYAGHVGVYVGDDRIVHNWSGKIVNTTIDYVVNCGYPWRGWGWNGNYVLGSGKSVDYPIIGNGTYSIRSACNENKALDVFTQSLNDKANVHLWDVGSQNSQKWKIEKNGSYYTIVNVNSGKALDVANGATTSGTNVWQYSANGTAAQNWYFEDAGNGYYYIRSACGLYLDLYGSQTANGTSIMVYNNNGGNNNQKWKLVSCTETAVSDTSTSVSNNSTSVSSDNWGAWSAWTTDKITATENRQVETGTAYVYYHYVLQDEDGCGAYPINNATMKANGFTFYNEYYHEHVSFDELPRDTSGRLTYIVNGTRMIYDRFKNQFCNSNHNFIYSNYVYYKGTTTKYRYRDRI